MTQGAYLLAFTLTLLQNSNTNLLIVDDHSHGSSNQALTGYGAVSVYGPQIFELLGFGTRKAEFLTLGNYISYFLMMTFAWLSIDVVG